MQGTLPTELCKPISYSFQNYTLLLNMPAWCFDFNVYKQANVNMVIRSWQHYSKWMCSYWFATIFLYFIRNLYVRIAKPIYVFFCRCVMKKQCRYAVGKSYSNGFNHLPHREACWQICKQSRPRSGSSYKSCLINVYTVCSWKCDIFDPTQVDLTCIAISLFYVQAWKFIYLIIHILAWIFMKYKLVKLNFYFQSECRRTIVM